MTPEQVRIIRQSVTFTNYTVTVRELCDGWLRLHAENERLRKQLGCEWIDQPDGPGWWWHDSPHFPRYVDGDMTVFWGGECTHVSKVPGKWCRAIVPQHPEVK